MSKQCGSCKYGRAKPTKECACNNKVKSLNEIVQMKYNGADMPYCEAYKPEYKGQIMSSKKGPKIQTKRNPTNKRNHERAVEHWVRVLNKKFFYHCKAKGE